MSAHLIGIDGPQKGLLISFELGDNWIIGRDPKLADYIIEDTTVSRKHLKVSKTNEEIVIRNLSKTNPVLVNGEEIKGNVQLSENDLVQLGSTIFRFSKAEAPQNAIPAAKKQNGYDSIFGDLETEAPQEIAEEIEVLQEEIKEEEPSYDTIFETDDEDLPLNLLSPAPLILKVISGPNSGAEIGIEKNHSYTLGKDSNSCEIVFQDMSVSRTHARLFVSEEGVISIEDLGSKNKTMINGVLIEGEKIITSQDIVSLGTTSFLIIDRDAPQETIYTTSLPSHLPAPSNEEIEAAAFEMAAETETAWKKKPIPTKHLILGGSAAAIFLIVFLSFFSLFKSDTIEVVIKKPEQQIEDALQKYEDVQFSFNAASGKLFLVGHVTTSVDFKEMKYQIEQIPFVTSVENSVVIDELVWRSTNDVLSANPNWRGVVISSSKPGRFIVSGYLQNNEEAAELTDYLNINFPYTDRLENKVVVESNLNLQLQSLVQAHKFHALNVQMSNGDLILTGRYNEERKSEFEKFIQDLTHVPGVSNVENYAVATSPSNTNIDISSLFKVTGSSLHDGKGYSIVLNGKIYTIGDLVDGMKITQIDPNIVLLEKEGLKYKIDYSR